MRTKREANEGPATNLRGFGATLGALLGHFLGYEGGFGVLWGRFGVTLSLLRAYFWHMRMILGCLWCHLGCMEVNFQKLFIFPMNFNDLFKYWIEFG